MDKCYVRLNGRLGNQLFQIAAGYNYSRKFDKELIIYECPYQLSRGYYQDNCGTPYKNSIFENLKFSNIEFNTINLTEENIHNFYAGDVSTDGLVGYFQSLDYFKEVSDDYKKLLVLPELSKDLVADVAFHIRRGDYMDIPNASSICNTEYFNKCFERFTNLNVNIFTDSPNHVITEFENIPFTIIQTGSTIKDLTLISMHDNVVCSNSSFSWWGSFLGSPKKEIIVPPRWMVDSECSEIYREDFTKLL